MTRTPFAYALLFACSCLWAGAQATPASPTTAAALGPDFGVATVKPNDTGSGSTRISINDDLLQATNVRLDSMLEIAFDIRRDEIIGLPHWAQVNHYDITAKVVDMTPEQLRGLSDAQRRAMLQSLLEQRFHLKSHVESRTLPLLKLTVDKAGIKFTEYQNPPEGQEDKKGNMSVNNEVMTATGIPMRSLVRFLSSQTHMPVVDETGLKGNYNFSMKWQRDDQGTDAGLHDQGLPTLYAALPEQLGLKLESGKGPVDVLVVDNIDQPSGN
jgi:uncharacterized protein (TIGR03435 family)